uniref:PIH1 N-terminal domain-containing protein n=1 Tax=Moniliophthora roreri TaxID=221103 RepID=A0A0W0FFJ2_MONRR
MSNTVPVSLKPVAGFCIKSTTLQPAVYTPASPTRSPNSLEPKILPITVPAGFKIFVNVAWNANVPPPPECSEEAIKRAMEGQTSDENGTDGSGEYFVPVVVSEGRQDTDKAGKPSLVFDCVFHKSVKTRTLIDHEYKVFIIELSLQRIEAQTGLLLSRNIGTPNIAAKGKLEPRTVSIPSFLAPTSSSDAKKKPLIEEIASTEPESVKPPSKPKGILKGVQQSSSSALASASAPRAQQKPLQWSWSKQNDQIHLSISVPRLVSTTKSSHHTLKLSIRRSLGHLKMSTYSLRHTLGRDLILSLQDKSTISKATFDIEPRRFILSVPNHPILDVDLRISDAEIVSKLGTATAADTEAGSGGILTLKRQREFQVENVTAEWRMVEDKLVIVA